MKGKISLTEGNDKQNHQSQDKEIKDQDLSI